MRPNLRISSERADLLGMPHMLDDYCQICGRWATNRHHIIPKGMGGGSKITHFQGKKLYSPLISVCGSGNQSGCHGGFHNSRFKVEWVPYDATFWELWWSGELLKDYKSNDPRLWDLGFYRIFERGKLLKEITK